MEIVGGFAVWGLLFARTAGVALLVPPVGHPQVPLSLRIAASAFFAVPLLYLVEEVPQTAVGVTDYAGFVAVNLVVGLAVGAAVAAVLYGAMIAGGYLDTVAGWSEAEVSRRPGGQGVFLFTIALFVLIDGHHAVIGTLAASFAVIPPVPADVTALAHHALVAWPAKMFTCSVLIAAPALLAALLARTVIAVAERLFEQLRDSGLSAAGGSLLSLAALALTLPVVAWAALSCIHRALSEIEALMGM